jgi:hypothetical protein
MDISKFDKEIQNALNNLFADIQKIKTTVEKNEELKEITKKTLAEINEELQKIQPK